MTVHAGSSSTVLLLEKVKYGGLVGCIYYFGNIVPEMSYSLEATKMHLYTGSEQKLRKLLILKHGLFSIYLSKEASFFMKDLILQILIVTKLPVISLEIFVCQMMSSSYLCKVRLYINASADYHHSLIIMDLHQAASTIMIAEIHLIPLQSIILIIGWKHDGP